MSAFPSYGPLIESRCPQCNYKLTAAMLAHGEQASPREGDNSVCINCGQVLTYQPDLTLRKVTAQEISELMADRQAWATIEESQRFILKRGRLA